MQPIFITLRDTAREELNTSIDWIGDSCAQFQTQDGKIFLQDPTADRVMELLDMSLFVANGNPAVFDQLLATATSVDDLDKDRQTWGAQILIPADKRITMYQHLLRQGHDPMKLPKRYQDLQLVAA